MTTLDSPDATNGTGLGLALASWIAHAHGGDIRVESVVGKGSVFTVTLPLAGAAPMAASEESAGQER